MKEKDSLHFWNRLEIIAVKNKWLILGVLVLFLLLFFYVSSSLANPRSDYLEVSFINVGQGDSILIRDPSGFDILIDGGKSSAGPTVVAYLRQQGVDDIDVMLASHADSDHIGGLIDVLNATDIPVQAVLYNGYPGDTTPWAIFATAVANDGLTLTPVAFPLTYTWGTTSAYMLNPVAGLGNPDQNAASVVVLLEYGQTRFVFTGDIDSTVEATIVARGTPIPAQILKVAHHGSESSSSDAFLSAVRPEQAIISVGPNSYGHPSSETIARLLAIGAEIWRTDYKGMILVTSDGLVYRVRGIFPGNIIFMPVLVR
jgi:beta-lactamase superfamily II metal-dependent hydrolase